MKFEKGKKVRVVRNSNNHQYEVPSIVTMDVGYGDYFDAKEIVNGNWWTVMFSDCEEIESQDKVKEEIEDKPQRYKSREIHGMDVIDLVNHWNLNFSEGNILKYLLRDKGEDESDLEKIIDYAQRELKRIRTGKK